MGYLLTSDTAKVIANPILNVQNSVEYFDPDKLVVGNDADYGELFLYWETPRTWHFRKYAHLLISGATGSGKTVALKELLYNLYQKHCTAKLWLCDYKNDDFRFCEGLPRYYGFTRCADGLNDFCAAFRARHSGEDDSCFPLFLVFDEWSAYISTLDKKATDAEKAKLSELLMLGRSFNVHIISSLQRPDAEYLKGRDNYGAVLGMGNLSKEAKEMLFSEVKEQLHPIEEIGIGYFLQGSRLNRIWVKHTSEQTTHDAIKRMLT